jgi:hypothetical protein
MTELTKSLTPLETEAIRLLLAGEHPVLAQLRRQVDQIAGINRQFTGAGFYTTFELGSDVPGLPGLPRFAISDVSGSLGGTANGACFVLFIEAGKIKMLEGATFGFEDKWPSTVSTFKLGYDAGQRDWAALGQTLAVATNK